MELSNPLLIHYKSYPHNWSILLILDGVAIEGDIRPHTRKRLEEKYDIEINTGIRSETYEVLILSPKK